jgi:paraquat-inducible protein A
MSQRTPTAASAGLALCRACHCLVSCGPNEAVRCRRCGAQVTQRKLHSLQITWIYVAVASVLLIPANVLPIMNLLQFGRGEPDTILSGIVRLVHEGFHAIAFIVFVASFLVPIGKLAALSMLLVSVQQRWLMSAVRRAQLFRLLEFLGRWSMLDVFVTAIMVALVHLGQVVVILPGAGAMMFGASVVFTMLASMSFDPRLIWDAADDADFSATEPRS